MMHIRDNFGEGPVTQVPASWYNSVAKFINNLVGGHRVKVEKFADGTPSSISFVADEKDVQRGEKTTPDPTKGVSAHPDYYNYPDKQENPDSPAIVFPDWQRYYDMPGTDHVPPARLTGADGVTPVGWERGKTAWKNGHDVDKDHQPVGLSMTVITHMRQITVNGTAKYQAMFSRMDFDENGLLVRVVPCTNWYTMM